MVYPSYDHVRVTGTSESSGSQVLQDTAAELDADVKRAMARDAAHGALCVRARARMYAVWRATQPTVHFVCVLARACVRCGARRGPRYVTTHVKGT
jgi:hypothetical protein